MNVMLNYGTRFLVDTSDFLKTTLIREEDVSPSIDEGEVLLQIDQFAYTSNNVTYAMVGHRIGYWKFFPVDKEGLGIIPCWGFANVIKSHHPDVKEGVRYYGYYPMASHLKIKPGHISNMLITDSTTHRLELPVIYNQLINCSADPLYQLESEDLQSLIRPLFTTSFLIHDQYVQNQFYSSDQILLISASSKTALSLAHCLQNEPVQVIGLTSPRNLEMVRSSGYYDDVYTYDDISSIPEKKSSIVDFAGNHTIQLDIQDHLGALIQMITMVGMVRWEDHKGQRSLSIQPEFFFAPTYAAKRIKEMGQDQFNRKLAKSYLHFMNEIKHFIHIKYYNFTDDITGLHRNMVKGTFDANLGNIVRL